MRSSQPEVNISNCFCASLTTGLQHIKGHSESLCGCPAAAASAGHSFITMDTRSQHHITLQLSFPAVFLGVISSSTYKRLVGITQPHLYCSLLVLCLLSWLLTGEQARTHARNDSLIVAYVMTRDPNTVEQKIFAPLFSYAEPHRPLVAAALCSGPVLADGGESIHESRSCLCLPSHRRSCLVLWCYFGMSRRSWHKTDIH